MPKTPSMVSVRKQGRKPTSGAIDALLKEAWAAGDIEPDKTLRLAEEARALSIAIGYEMGVAHSFRATGLAALRQTDYAKAIADFSEAEKRFTAGGDIYFAVHTASLRCIVYGQQNDYPKAMETAQACRTQARQHGFTALEANAMSHIGVIHRRLGDYASALDIQLQNLLLRRACGDRVEEAHTLNNIGVIYSTLENYPQALHYHRQSLALKETLGEQYGIAESHLNIGLALTCNRQSVEALPHLTRAVEAFRVIGDRDAELEALNALTQTQISLGNTSGAFETLEKGLVISSVLGEKRMTAVLFLNLGEAHLLTGDRSAASDAFQHTLRLAQETGAQQTAFSAHLALADLYESLGDAAQALFHFKQCRELERKLVGETTQHRLISLQISFDVERREKEHQLLQLKAEKLEQETSRQKQELVSLAMALVEKNEFIDKLKIDLAEISSLSVPCETKFADMLHQLDRERSAEQSWKLFEQQFSGIYGEFIARLTAHCNTLTPVELKIAALLKLNLATKDIARALNTSPRTVDNHRHRLRAKLRLKASDNITSFLSAL